MSLPSADQLEAAGWTRLPDQPIDLDELQERGGKLRQIRAVLDELAPLDPPTYEYAEARSLGDVNRLAAQGWRVHTALLVPASGMKVYLLERERP